MATRCSVRQDPSASLFCTSAESLAAGTCHVIATAADSKATFVVVATSAESRGGTSIEISPEKRSENSLCPAPETFHEGKSGVRGAAVNVA